MELSELARKGRNEYMRRYYAKRKGETDKPKNKEELDSNLTPQERNIAYQNRYFEKKAREYGLDKPDDHE